MHTTDVSVLSLKNLTKIYGNAAVVDAITFTLNRGEIVGLLGPNGAGKTTTLNMILGLIEPSSGSIRIFDKELTGQSKHLLQKVNFAAVYAHLPSNLSVKENLMVFSLLYNSSDPRATVDRLLDEFDLGAHANTKTGLLSSGEQARLALAKALINTPHLLLLDEPTASLDPHHADIMRDKIKEYIEKTQASILWTSHDMNEIAAMCDRVLFLSHGKILLEGNPRELPASHGKKNLEELFISVAREPLEFVTRS